MPNFPPYACGACGSMFERFDDFDAHRRTAHGHDADGTLLSPARATMELRVAALERTVERLVKEMERMQEGGKP